MLALYASPPPPPLPPPTLLLAPCTTSSSFHSPAPGRSAKREQLPVRRLALFRQSVWRAPSECTEEKRECRWGEYTAVTPFFVFFLLLVLSFFLFLFVFLLVIVFAVVVVVLLLLFSFFLSSSSHLPTLSSFFRSPLALLLLLLFPLLLLSFSCFLPSLLACLPSLLPFLLPDVDNTGQDRQLLWTQSHRDKYLFVQSRRRGFSANMQKISCSLRLLMGVCDFAPGLVLPYNDRTLKA